MHVKSHFLTMAAPAHDGGNIEIDKDQQNEAHSELDDDLAAEVHAAAVPHVQSVCVRFKTLRAKIPYNKCAHERSCAWCCE